MFVHWHGNGVIRKDFVYLDPRLCSIIVSGEKRQKTYDRFGLCTSIERECVYEYQARRIVRNYIFTHIRNDEFARLK